jgi:electron transfer flavoprotein beta subunit
MPNIVVLVKQVPDTATERKLSDGDHTLLRDTNDSVIDEINERAVEAALQLTEAQGGEITLVSVGPEHAIDAIRKGLSMGADKAIHVSDPALHGADVLQTANVLAAAIRRVDNLDLVIAGNESSDGSSGAVPAILAELLGYPQLTHARTVEVDGTTIRVDRETEDGITHLEATLPALVSVGEKINQPRYPSFKGIMAAKKKPVDTLTVADLGVDTSEIGLDNAWSTVLEAAPKPPRSAGQKVTDEGDGGAQIAAFLVSQKLI